MSQNTFQKVNYFLCIIHLDKCKLINKMSVNMKECNKFLRVHFVISNVIFCKTWFYL